MTTIKGFIKDWQGNRLLPITRAELVLDQDGQIALQSSKFLAGEGHPGLITAEEREMLSGTTGQSITDIYDKLGYINSGLKVGDNALSFYDTTGATPISIVGADGVTVGIANNTLQVKLAEVTGAEASITGQILRNIAVDKYGRVTSVSAGTLSNDDIPATLSGKVLSGCTVAADPTADLGIANKKYVDDKFNASNAVATGALKFGGQVADVQALNTLISKLTNPTEADLNTYYKVTGSNLTVAATNLHYHTVDAHLKVGDTLIIYRNEAKETKLVYIPSADDITTISFYKDSAEVVKNLDGNVGFNFVGPAFSVTHAGALASIEIPNVKDSVSGGYLSKIDYEKLMGYETSLAVSYTPTVTDQTAGHYVIGKLTIGGTENTIYGKNSVSSLSLSAETNKAVLTFTETGQKDTTINIAGGTGVNVTTNDKTITLATQLSSGNETYIQAQGNTVTPVIGKIDSTQEKGYTDGLVDFATHADLLTRVIQLVEVIDYSLSGEVSGNQTFKYGSTALKTAISLTNL